MWMNSTIIWSTSNRNVTIYKGCQHCFTMIIFNENKGMILWWIKLSSNIEMLRKAGAFAVKKMRTGFKEVQVRLVNFEPLGGLVELEYFFQRSFAPSITDFINISYTLILQFDVLAIIIFHIITIIWSLKRVYCMKPNSGTYYFATVSSTNTHTLLSLIQLMIWFLIIKYSCYIYKTCYS